MDTPEILIWEATASDLRVIANEMRSILRAAIPDEVDVARIDAFLSDALARQREQTPDPVRIALLHDDPAMRSLVRMWFDRFGASWSDRFLLGPWTDPNGIIRTGRPDEPWSPAVVPRHLNVSTPTQVEVDRRFPVVVWISLARSSDGTSQRLRDFDVPPEGVTLTITVVAPDLVTDGDLEQDVHVPSDGESDPVRFVFRAERPGPHAIRVLVYRGGTFLGQLTVQVVAGVTGSARGTSESAGLTDLRSDPGEVTLQVAATGDRRYSFHLIGPGGHRLDRSERLAGNPRQVVERIVTELCEMATGESPYPPEERRTRLRNLGVRLWAEAVPAAVRRQFWTDRDRITSFNVISTVDDVPWELLYPLDEGSPDQGFLVEQLPVVRRLPEESGTRSVTLDSSAFVVPPDAPPDALDEVGMVQSRLGAGVSCWGLLRGRRDLGRVLEDPPSVLHFAGHNEFSDETGSVIYLQGGPFQPSDIFPARQLRALRHSSPIVFFNACRTAGRVPGLTETTGWAEMFIAAGAAVFIGSSWAIRSNTAGAFAESFYDSFVVRRRPLGQALLEARRHIRTDDGDPTWLAYAAYGNPAATVANDG